MSLPRALLIRNVRPLGQAPVDLLVRDGRIAAIGAALAPPAEAQVEEEDGGGALLLPGLVEGHTHLDKTLWGMDWYRNEVGTRLVDKIDNEREFRHASGHDAATCAIDGDPVRSLDLLFGIAERRGCGIDIHLHEPGAMGAFSLGLIMDRVAALGMQGRVAISHGFCLGDLPPPERDPLIARMAQLGLVLITSAPASRSVPPLMACRQAGLTVLGGNDGIRDTWSPFGNPDMLERAMLIGLRYNLRRDDELDVALDCVTYAGARGCGFAAYGLAPGDRADLVLVEARTVAEAIVARPARRRVVAGGRIVARDGALI